MQLQCITQVINQNSIDLKLDPLKWKRLTLCLIGYLLQSVNYKEFNKIVPFLPGKNRRALRQAMLNSSEMVVDLKFALVEVSNENWNLEKGKKIWARYGLPFCDLEQVIKNKTFISAYLKKEILFPVEEHEREMSILHIVNENWWYCKNYVYKKLRFLLSSGLTVEDLIYELMACAIKSVYVKVPFISPNHAMALARRSITNAGLNLIEHYTRQSQQRLLPTNDNGFINRIRQINDDVRDINDSSNDLISTISIRQLLETSGERESVALQLLLGHEVQDFVSYCGRKKTTTVNKIQETTTPEEYQKQIQSFLGVSHSEWKAWETRWKTELTN